MSTVDSPVSALAVSAVQRTEVVFIESNVADYQTLLKGIDSAKEIHVLNAGGDGLTQMAQILTGRSRIDAIHIISHGATGTVQLGTLTLDDETLQNRKTDLASIGQSLSTDGDLLLYGCNVGQGLTGIDFIGKLAQATGADVAGSTDLTGKAATGGDWVLEYQTGDIEAQMALLQEGLQAYSGLLALPSGVQAYNFYDMTDAGNTLTNVYFVVSATTSAANPANMSVSAPTSGYVDDSSIAGSLVTVRVATNSPDFASFELTDINLSDYEIALSAQNLHVVGHKADGSGTVSTNSVNGSASDDTYASTSFSNWAVFSGIQLDYFEIVWNLANAANQAPFNMDLVSFSVANMTAPVVIPAPKVTNVTSAVANDICLPGDTIQITVKFDQSVSVTGTPQLTLETGTIDRTISYVSGSGTDTLTFSYMVQAGDVSDDLDYKGTTALALNGGFIKNGTGTDADLTLPTPGLMGSLGANKGIVIDTNEGTLPAGEQSYNLTALTDFGTTLKSDYFFVNATFDGSGAAMNNDGGSGYVDAGRGASSTSTVRIKVAADALDVGSFELTNINLSDFAGHDTNIMSNVQIIGHKANGSGTVSTVAVSGTTADDTFTSASFSNWAVFSGVQLDYFEVIWNIDNSNTANAANNVDFVSFSVTNLTAPGASAEPTIANITSSAINGVYVPGDIIEITVEFSQTVTVTGTPQITLETGATDRAIDYVSGSGSRTLTFNYAVQDGDVSGDLDYKGTTALVLNGGTIQNVGGTNADLTLPSPGSLGSLGANKGIVIDTNEGTLPAGAQSYSLTGFTDFGTALKSDYFVVNASFDGSSADINNNGGSGYVNATRGASGTSTVVIKLAADALDVGSFELTNIDLSDYVSNITNIMSNVQIIGHAADGSGTVSTVTVSGTTADDTFTSASFSNWAVFSGVQLDYFEITWNIDNSNTNNAAQYVDFVSFSVTNLTAPANGHAPVTTLPSVPAISEDSSTNAISGISIVDVDGDAQTVVLTATHGTFSLPERSGLACPGYNDNSTLLTFSGNLVDVNAALANLTFTPDASFSGTATLQVQTSDGHGNSDDDTLNISVSAINDAPTLTATGATTNFTENGLAVDLFSAVSISTVESGQAVNSLTLTVDNLADGANEKLVIDGSSVALTDGINGTSTGGSSILYAVSVAGSTATVSLTKAGGLTAAQAQTLVNGLGYSNASESPDMSHDRVITLTSVQDTGGTANGGVDATSLSIASTVHLIPVNDAPVLDAAASPTLADIKVSVSGPTGVVGSLVSSLVDIGGGLHNVADPDASPVTGIAITAADDANGTWYYSENGGTNWTVLGPVATDSALLLAADADTRVYFSPTSAWTGSATITFRAWDQTSGLAGSKADASVNGGTSAFSTTTDTAQVTVVPLVSSITSATYDASSGVLSVTGTDMTSGDTIEVGNLTLKGQGDSSYTLTSPNTTASSATAFSVTLNATDKLAVNGLLNKAGTSAVDTTDFNLAAASNWDSTAGALADTTNAVTVSNVTSPTITSATYDVSTHILTVTGTNLVKAIGATNDITISSLTITGEGGATRTLSTTGNVEVTSATGFAVTLAGADQVAVEALFNQNGTSSTGTTTYNLAAADDWNSVINNADISVATAGITVSNVPVPTITSATYNAATGELVVTGTGFLSLSGGTNDIIANKLTITGEGGATYTLTDTPSADVTSDTAFTLTLSATDKAAIDQNLNKAGTASTGATTYNLAAAEDWAAGADAAVVVADLTGNGIAVSNVPVPTITGATYDAATGTLTVTGASFSKLNGAVNDIVANKFTLTGEGGGTYTLTDTANVDITDGTHFTLSLSATDKASVNALVNKDGSASNDNTTYNLDAAEDWAAGADTAVMVADLGGNGVNRSTPSKLLTYSATTFAEGAANNGTITATITVTLTNDSFTGAVGAELGNVSNVPAGLTASLIKVDATHATLSFTGSAVAHANADDVSDLTVTFIDADFTGGSAATVTGATTANLIIDFADPATQPPTPPTPQTPPTPPVTDHDDDGISDTSEDATPGLPPASGGNAVAGDGNGDGVVDSTQDAVTSVPFLDTDTAVSQPGNAAPIYVTLVADSKEGTADITDSTSAVLTTVRQLDAPADKPAGLDLPLGLIGFTAKVSAIGITETFSLFVDDSLAINGYWKQDDTGTWVNLASKIEHVGDKTRIDFSIQDGSIFDADGVANGSIVDPGGIGSLPRTAASLEDQITGLYVAFYDRAPDAEGLAHWKTRLQSGSTTLSDIASGFSQHPRFTQEYGNLSHAEIAAKFYTNVLGQAGDATGISYWTNQLDQGRTASDVIAEFTKTSLNVDLLAAKQSGDLTDAEYTTACQRQTLLDNKVKAGLDFATLFGEDTIPHGAPTELSSDTAYNAAIQLLDSVSADPASAYALSAELVKLVGTNNPMQGVIDLV